MPGWEAKSDSLLPQFLTSRSGLEPVAAFFHSSAAAFWLGTKNKAPAAPAGLSSARFLKVRLPERHFHSLSCLSLVLFLYLFFFSRELAKVGEEGGRNLLPHFSQKSCEQLVDFTGFKSR